jgi:hypothetical protein
MIFGPKIDKSGSICAWPKMRVIGWRGSDLSHRSPSCALSLSNPIVHLSSFSTPCETMVRKAVQKPKPIVAAEAITSTTLRTGTKESPILLSSDESEGEESTRRPLGVTAVPQKRYFGVSPSDAYAFKGQGGAYDMMIAMGYKPDRGLGPNLRGSANSPLRIWRIRCMLIPSQEMCGPCRLNSGGAGLG